VTPVACVQGLIGVQKDRKGGDALEDMPGVVAGAAGDPGVAMGSSFRILVVVSNGRVLGSGALRAPP